MRKTFITITLFAVIPVLSFGQDYKEKIKSEYEKYLQHILNQNFDAALEYTYEDFFDIVPKEQMATLMKRIFENPEMEFRIEDTEIIEIGDSEQIEYKDYVLLKYSNIMYMKFNNSTNEESQKDKDLNQTLMKVSFEKTFGKGNVSFDNETKFWRIYAEKPVFAISKDNMESWKFLVADKDQMFILQQLLPQELIDKL